MVRALALAGLGLALVASTGCVRTELVEGGFDTATETVQVGSATRATVRVEMGAGQLDISGGADDLMDAEFEYSDSRWKPEVEYEVDGDEGTLEVLTPSNRSFPLSSNMRYAWDIRLGGGLPMDLVVDMGAGESELKLGGLDVRTLKVELGAGDTLIDLTGDDWRNDLEAEIMAGAGKVVLRVPANVGVRIVGYRDGVGSYKAEGFEQDGDDALLNDAWDNASVRFDIQLRRGVGDVTVETVK